MATLPKATTTASEVAAAIAAGTDLICIWAPVANSDDHVPRLFGKTEAIFDQHDYNNGLEYAALHLGETRKAVLFQGIPIVTAGAVSDVDVTGVTGTSVVTVVAGSDGVLGPAHSGILTVTKGGTIGTGPIEFTLSLDGGRTTKRVRLMTATSYAIPYVGVTLNFAAGTLGAGDFVTWEGSEARGDNAGWTAARIALANQLRPIRSVMLIGDVQDATEANNFNTQIVNFKTTNERAIYARVAAKDQTSAQTKAQWMTAIDTAFATVDAKHRIDIAAGRGRVRSPITGWYWRQPIAWAASLREFNHDLHVPVWRKKDGPVDFDLLDAQGNLVEWDDFKDGGGGSSARFTTARSWGNGPAGTFITLSLTRGTEGTLLSLTHNVAVVNLAENVCQAATENAIGRDLELNDDGTATTDSLNTIQTEVNAALELALLGNALGEGKRASKAVWTPSGDDVLNVPEATLTGVLELNLKGTIHSVRTAVKILSGGQS